MKLDCQTSTLSNRYLCPSNINNIFWQQWQQYRDSLYRCCLKWMGGNPTDAEDALSRATIKAWEKVQKYPAGEIANFKAWLTKLTHNLCIDIYRERSRGANRVEDIEAIGEAQGLVSFDDTPESALEMDEKKIVIRRAIDNLPTRLRETFILHFYQELSHQEIAQQQDISYQNVCKRISQARKILQEELREYFIGEERTDTDKSVPLAATESEIGEMSQGNAGVKAGAGETVLSVVVEDVESFGGEEASDEVGVTLLLEESAAATAVSEGNLELIQERNRGEKGEFRKERKPSEKRESYEKQNKRKKTSSEKDMKSVKLIEKIKIRTNKEKIMNTKIVWKRTMLSAIALLLVLVMLSVGVAPAKAQPPKPDPSPFCDETNGRIPTLEWLEKQNYEKKSMGYFVKDVVKNFSSLKNFCSTDMLQFYQSQKDILSQPVTPKNADIFGENETDYFAKSKNLPTKIAGLFVGPKERSEFIQCEYNYEGLTRTLDGAFDHCLPLWHIKSQFGKSFNNFE